MSEQPIPAYLGRLYSMHGWPLDRVISFTPEHIQQVMERACLTTFGWRPGLNLSFVGGYRTGLFRWIRGPDPSIALYGDWPDWMQSFEQEIPTEDDATMTFFCTIPDSQRDGDSRRYYSVVAIVSPLQQEKRDVLESPNTVSD